MIAGVDYDTNRVAVCLLELEGDEPPSFRTELYRRSSKVDAFSAVSDLQRAVVELLRSAAPRRFKPLGRVVDAWWIEHAFGKGPTDFKLGRVQGAIAATIHANVREPHLYEVVPPAWKKSAGLHGNAAKAAYQPTLRALLEEHGYGGVTTEHELDAFGIALHGRSLRS